MAEDEMVGWHHRRGSLVPFHFLCKGGVICISEVIDISPGNLDSSLCFIQPRVSHDHTLYCPSQLRAGVQAALPGKRGHSGLAGPAPPPAQQRLGKSRQPVRERAVEAAVEVDVLLLGAGGGPR